jgi:hypothetical protein
LQGNTLSEALAAGALLANLHRVQKSQLVFENSTSAHADQQATVAIAG